MSCMLLKNVPALRYSVIATLTELLRAFSCSSMSSNSSNIFGFLLAFLIKRETYCCVILYSFARSAGATFLMTYL